MEYELRVQLEELRDIIWGEDIPSSTCPEYREHHESIQKILKKLDVILDQYTAINPTK